ncbi:hypothetical protein [Pseudomonas turukhanskensis]|uniref:Uncharacterized protein n=1 Tax=Pseudomonas turukhanskensis TaxID=1806536 RepID=A0A9W6K6Z1_9PSED|nr:hypothetical protein [Pseudomonas turukhanskensis]GLK89376.1 hypothetical protein GCM10017655_24380 [Pseudomonas turukhanskensis]
MTVSTLPLAELSNRELANLYAHALKDIPPSLLAGFSEGDRGGLSGLYLPAIPDGYWQAATRVMIVGRETRGWGVVPKDEVCGDLTAYIERSIALQKKFQADHIGQLPDAKATFYNLARQVAKRCGQSGVVVGNLFCIAHQKTIPTASGRYVEILRYSEILLKLQIELLRPHIVIFANGSSSAAQRRAFFPTKGNNKVCFNGRYFLKDGISKNHLWAFEMNGMQCYRVHHPSSLHRKKADNARRFLMTLLPGSDTNAAVSAPMASSL